MKKIIVFLVLLSSLLTANAQVPELWGMAEGGGTNNRGVLFKINGDGSGYTIYHNFSDATGIFPHGDFSLYNNNGKLYGRAGANNSMGVIFSYDTLTQIFTDLFDFNDTVGFGGDDLTLGCDGKFYGINAEGGLYHVGNIFTFDPYTNVYSVIHSFDSATGYPPNSNLFLSNDGLFYGNTYYGGINNDGVIYSMDPVTFAYNVLYSYDTLEASDVPYHDFIQASNNLLYSMIDEGDWYGVAQLYSFNPVTHIYTTLHYFNEATGTTPSRTLMQASNGLLYGMTAVGGALDSGVIFSYNINTNVYTDLYDFMNSTGDSPLAGLIQASDGKLYGMTHRFGMGDNGTIFSFDTTTNALTVIHYFDGADGSLPSGNLLEFKNCVVPALTTSGNNSICIGDSTTITLQGAEQYYWRTMNSMDSVVTVSPTVTSSYVVMASNCTGCFKTDTIVITVNPNITPTITGDNVFCSGTSTTLSTGSYATYNWNNGSTNQTTIVDSASTYIVTVTNGNGCTGIASKTVTKIQSPAPSFTGSSSFCPGSSLVLNAGTFSQYNWSNGDTTQSITVTSANIYIVTVTALNGCTGTASDTVTLFPSPSPLITGVSSFCPGDSTILSTGPFVQYLWNTGSTNQSITVTTPNTYTVTVTDNNGCTGTTTDIITLIPPVNVQSSFHSDTTKGCTPLTINFINTSTNGTSYLWNFGDNTIDTAKNPTHTYLDSGSYSVKLIVTNVSPCGTVKDSITLIDYILVNVFKPVAAFTSDYIIPIYVGDSIHFKDGSYDPTSGYITLWRWRFGDGKGSNFLNPIHTWDLPGMYQVTLIVTNNQGCKDSTIYDYIEVIEGLIDIPNTFSPNNDGYNDFFEIRTSGIENLDVQIFNRWGILLFESKSNQILWDGYTQGGLQCPDGTYYYVLKATAYSGKNFSKAGFIMLLR